MRYITFICLLFSFTFNSFGEPGKDTLVYQYGNDTLLQTLRICQITDSSLSFSLTSENIEGKGYITMQGFAIKEKLQDPVLQKDEKGKEFPADVFIYRGYNCDVRFMVQYLHRELVWIEENCRKMKLNPRVPLGSIGVLMQVNPVK